MSAYGRNHLLKSIRIGNFKAVRDSRTVRFKPFTVLIGSNGSGKSGLMDALQTYQSIVLGGLSRCFAEGLPFEDLLNKYIGARQAKVMDFRFAAQIENAMMEWNMRLEASQSFDELGIVSEKLDMQFKGRDGQRCALDRERVKGVSDDLSVIASQQNGSAASSFPAGFGKKLYDYIAGWKFMTLAPENMRMPAPMSVTRKPATLHDDGSNLAEYLLHIKKTDPGAFNRIIETVQLVVPYVKDIQPTPTQEFKRKIYLNVIEKEVKMPSWLLSSGTLRLVALVAMLHAPEPPSLIFIDEMENGMDPCAMSVLMEEMRIATENGATQVIAATHSLHLLDLLNLSDIVLAERDRNNEPVFWRPAARKDIVAWSESFSPGQLYKMNRLKKE